MARQTLSRRQFLQIIAVGGVAGATAKLSFDSWNRMEPFSETRLLMGTVVNLTIVSADLARARAAVQTCLDRMEGLEKVMSRFIPESQLSQLNQVGFLAKADPALLQVVAEALEISQLSDGAFDITIKPVLEALQAGRVTTAAERAAVGYENINLDKSQITFLRSGMGITLDGIAKGFIVDRGVEVLHAHGFENILVEAGGDLVASGQRADSAPWKLGVADPRPAGPSSYLTSFSVTNQAVATSGDYIQYYQDDKSLHHIINPQTGSSPPELASVTVLAPTAMQADALSTTVMVLDLENGLRFINQQPDVEALVVTKDKQVYKSDQFPR